MSYDREEKVCNDCAYFEERTHFCRKNPPSVVVFSQEIEDEHGGIKTFTKAATKFPVISKPDLDFCYCFKACYLID
jgi:hypothetical protein